MAFDLQLGFEIVYNFLRPTPVILVVNIHDSRVADIIVRDELVTVPAIPVSDYTDSFGNRCKRIVAPGGRLILRADGIIRDAGLADEVPYGAGQSPVEELPEDTLVYLLGSRYCETELLSQAAWQLFGGTGTGH